jgi:hypothetical protein
MAITFCIFNCGSGGLPTSVFRTTFGGTRTEIRSQSTTKHAIFRYVPYH